MADDTTISREVDRIDGTCVAESLWKHGPLDCLNTETDGKRDAGNFLACFIHVWVVRKYFS